MRSSGILPLGMILLSGALSWAPALHAQTAAEIMGRAAERYEQRLSGVEDLIVRQEIMGISTTTYLVKETTSGRASLVTRAGSAEMGAIEMDMTEDLTDLWADPRFFDDEWVERWSLEGAGSVDGRSTWRLALTDFEGLEWNALDAGQDLPFEARSMALELDQEDLVPLEILLEGDVVDGVERRPVALVVRLGDYRSFDGYLHPFRTVLETDLAAAGLSPEEVDQARAGLEELRRQLEQAPQAQRDMMERMMGDQIRMLEEMIAGDRIELEVRVTELRINPGPPAND